MKAVIVGYNFEADDSFTSEFQGENCYLEALEEIHEDSYIHRDFPAKDGWKMTIMVDQEAEEKEIVKKTKLAIIKGSIRLNVPL